MKKGAGVTAPFREIAALFLVASVAFLALAAFAALVLRGGSRGFRRLFLDGRHVGGGRDRLRSGGERSLDPPGGRGSGGFPFPGDRPPPDLRPSDRRNLA